MPTLIDNPVQCAPLPRLWVRVDKDILVALAHDLRVKARNHLLRDHHIVGWVASNADDILRQWQRKLIGVNIGDDFNRSRATGNRAGWYRFGRIRRIERWRHTRAWNLRPVARLRLKSSPMFTPISFRCHCRRMSSA